ncbi:unnamed protein product [Nesidiocoris tenuis]|uniref:Uncharacterized protein n=1 Tax=Nesidiocoris tenuis TaxID=355587 RepID=A0A6H5G8T4_9HEMI|nr:unnamed protein product [Nesidiocoris tenuis]
MSHRAFFLIASTGIPASDTTNYDAMYRFLLTMLKSTFFFCRRLVKTCFPKMDHSKIRCFELYCIHSGGATSSSVLEQSHRLASTICEVSGMPSNPLDILCLPSNRKTEGHAILGSIGSVSFLTIVRPLSNVIAGDIESAGLATAIMLPPLEAITWNMITKVMYIRKVTSVLKVTSIIERDERPRSYEHHKRADKKY